MARPTDFTPEIGQDICDWISGGRSLAGYCRDNSLGYSTVMQWLKAWPTFAEDYTCAREAAGDADADVVTDIRERVLAGELEPAAAKVAIDAAKWSAGIRQPAKYGARIDVTSGGEKITNESEADKSARLAAILAAAASRRGEAE